MTQPYSVKPNDGVPYEIRYADEDLLVVEKPSGVVTQPGKKHEDDSLLNGLFVDYGSALQNLGADRGWGLLHRLDKGTSGLVLVSLRPRAYDNLIEQFKKKQIKKRYWAIVYGTPKPAQAVLQKPIVEITGSRKRAIIKRDGKKAITAYRVIESGDGVSLVEARPKTGRLHQIRVHMATIGCPVLGEDMYAGKIKLPNVFRLCLHATSLSFIHPTSGQRMTVDSPWPGDLAKTLKRFELSQPV